MIADLDVAVKAARRESDREAGEAAAVGRAGKAAKAEVERLREQLELHEKVLGVLTRVGEERQESAQRQVEGLVTRALQVIFDENLSFRLVPSVKSNRAEIDFVLRSHLPDGTDVDTSAFDQGGGRAAVIGFVLRLVVLLLTPGARRILFLDETFGMVSAEYEPRLAEFLREVADKAGVQIVLITHSRAFDDLADESAELSLGADGATVLRQAGAARPLARTMDVGTPAAFTPCGSRPPLVSASLPPARRRTGPLFLSSPIGRL